MVIIITHIIHTTYDMTREALSVRAKKEKNLMAPLQKLHKQLVWRVRSMK